jgi:hypothetical protein
VVRVFRGEFPLRLSASAVKKDDDDEEHDNGDDFKGRPQTYHSSLITYHFFCVLRATLPPFLILHF